MIEYYTKKGVFYTCNYDAIPYRELHRVDGPALLDFGDEHWYLNGQLHRIGGPATDWNSGYKEYVVHGKFHRLDGPAIEKAKGGDYYFINGKQLNTKEVENWLKSNNIDLKTKTGQALFMLRFG